MTDTRRETVLKAVKTALEVDLLAKAGDELDTFAVSEWGAQTGPIRTGAGQFNGRGQTFTVPAGGTPTRFQFHMRRNGSPTGIAYFRIYAITGTFGTTAIPTGSPLVHIPFDVTTISTTMSLVAFDVSTWSPAAGNYVATIEFDGGDVSNDLALAILVGGTHAGNAVSKDADDDTWQASPTHDVIFVLLDSMACPKGYTVGRHPERAFEAGDLPRSDVFLRDETVDYSVTDAQVRTLTVEVLSTIKWTDDDAPSGDEALDTILTWVEAALVNDVTLGGASSLVLYTGMAIPDIEERADKFAQGIQTFEVTFQTHFGNPRRAA